MRPNPKPYVALGVNPYHKRCGIYSQEIWAQTLITRDLRPTPNHDIQSPFSGHREPPYI